MANRAWSGLPEFVNSAGREGLLEYLPDAPHEGTGAAPGPTINQPIDMSINYNSPIGQDPVAHAQQQQRTQERVLLEAETNTATDWGLDADRLEGLLS